MTCWRARAVFDHTWVSAGLTRGPGSASRNSTCRPCAVSLMRTVLTAAWRSGSSLPLYASRALGAAAASSSGGGALFAAAALASNPRVIDTVLHDIETLLALLDSASVPSE